MVNWLIDHLINENKPTVWGLHISFVKLQHLCLCSCDIKGPESLDCLRILASCWNKL